MRYDGTWKNTVNQDSRHGHKSKQQVAWNGVKYRFGKHQMPSSQWDVFAINKLSWTLLTLMLIWSITSLTCIAVEWRFWGSEFRISREITQGGQLRCSWKFKNPVDALTMFIIANWMHGKAHTQPHCCLPTWKCSTWLIILFIHSLEPSVWGWYTVDIFSFTPQRECKAFQKWDINNLSLSEIMSKGNPFSQYQWSKNKIARSSVVMSTWMGTIRILAPMQSVIDKIQLNPESSFSGLMKSIVMDFPWPYGTGRGCKGPGVLDVEILFYWHGSHDGMYAFWGSCHILGQ